MEKIAIIGSPGSGKTTLAKTLCKILNIKVYHLDRLFWKSGWQSIDGPTRINTMESLIHEKQWIIEGTYLRSSKPRLNDADTIFFWIFHSLYVSGALLTGILESTGVPAVIFRWNLRIS